MRIKETAARLGLSPRAIRFYEEKGLIAPAKERSSQYRTFDEDDVRRLQTIVALREAGLGIDDIQKALPAGGKDDGGGAGEVARHLELRRSEMVSAWVELKRMIETADGMLAMLASEQELPADAMFRLAQEARDIRELRSSWQDVWDYDGLAETHDERVAESSGEYTEYAEALGLIVSWIAAAPGEEGLDLGTGTGNLAGMLLRQGAKMAGVDQSLAMLQRCRAKFPEIETKVGNLLAIPYTAEKFDFVVSSFALQHLSAGQLRLALEEMLRVLKPRGRICIADLMTSGDRVREQLAEAFPGHKPLAALAELSGYFERRGYVVKIRRIHGLLHVVYAVPIR